ncbi:MAG: hypothetical protein Q9219_001503 [cf. Caloplaca sp. 3 TL-2023]
MNSERGFKELKDEVSSALVSTTRIVGQIANEDLAFQRSINPGIDRLIDEQSQRLLSLVRNLNRTATAGTETVPPPLNNVESVEDGWRGIVDIVDNLLEKADACLDEFTGVVKKLTPNSQGDAAATDAKRPLAKHEYRFQNLPKPQRLFRTAPKNDETTPFKPLLQRKPNAILPLEESLVLAPAPNGSMQYQHPYASEITQSTYPDSAYVQRDPIPFLPFESTDAVWVDTPEAVHEMLRDLKQAEEIAVDLEHHEIHTYVGLVSLMQISTREKDWIVDTLVPWREDLQILNEVFTDPRIIKVLHGSTSDIVWLQRDLGLYIVGLFDTYHASNVLGYPKHGLAYLLHRFAHFDTDKRYQMADWRMRPLPKQMYDYARSDTHFLLYIFDNMRNELLKSGAVDQDGNLMDKVRDLSKDEALQRYERFLYDAEAGPDMWGWNGFFSRSASRFDRQQTAVLRAVHAWRDRTARHCDENLQQILTNKAMLVVAREMPTEMPALLGFCQPLHKETRTSAAELLQVIKEAKIAGINEPEPTELIRPHAHPQTHHSALARTASSASVGVASTAVQASSLVNPGSCNTLATLEKSHFWGATLETGMQKSDHPEHTTPRLALPLPPLTAEVFQTQSINESPAPVMTPKDPGARAEHQYVKKRKNREEDILVLKQPGGSKKHKANETRDGPEPFGQSGGDLSSNIITDGDNQQPLGTTTAGIDFEGETDEIAKRRKERKMRRRSKKEQLKQTGQGKHIQMGGGAEKSSAVPPEDGGEVFDYEKASTVLHAQTKHGGAAGATKGIDPYSKSLDAPKGLRKVQREGPGRSMTYKS